MSIILTLEIEVKTEIRDKQWRASLGSDGKWFPEKKGDNAEECKWETRAEDVFNRVPANISARTDRKITTVQLRYDNHPGKNH